MEPVPSALEKTYPPRGPLQQHRFLAATAFHCFRCGALKKSKLITVYGGDWARRLCNGCYGRLLSLYALKAGTGPDEEKVEKLAEILLSLIEGEHQREAERLLLTSERRAEKLSPSALRFLATSEYLARHLRSAPELEWSPATIGVCKAFEAEIVNRLIRPLVKLSRSVDMTEDSNDRDIGRVAAFCTDPAGKPPELGAVAHFLQTAIHSQARRETSPLLKIFLSVARDWPGSPWILDPNGLCQAISTVAAQYRNRAAHVDELGEDDYRACFDLVAGSDGALWKLVLAVEKPK